MSSPSVEPSVEATLPPLRIHHFLLWTAVSAVMMTLYGTATQATEDVGLSRILTFQAMSTGLPQAIAITTFGLGLYWNFRGFRFFGEVGHWLLAMSAFAFLFKVVNGLLLSYFGWSSYGPVSFWIYGHQIVEQLGLGLLFFFASRRAADTRPWKLFCFVNIFWQIALSLLMLYNYLFPGGYFLGLFSLPLVEISTIALCLLAMFALFHDLSTKRVRHWSHWCGVLLWMLMAVSDLVFAIYLRFFYVPA